MNILRTLLALLALSSATQANAQSLAPGTALPISLNSSLKAKGSKPGQKLEGKLMQEVPSSDGSMIKKGSRVTGQVLSVQSPSKITIRFDNLQDEHQLIPLNVAARALAQSDSVFQAGLPIDASSTYEGSNSWTTKQIGGDVVFRGRGYVASDQGKIGRWSGSGVWAKLSPAGDCPATDINGQEQALWVFSTSACGAYGFDDQVKITHAGRTEPVGQITLESTKELNIGGGSGWLLVVNAAPAGAPPKN